VGEECRPALDVRLQLRPLRKDEKQGVRDEERSDDHGDGQGRSGLETVKPERHSRTYTPPWQLSTMESTSG
jgi:hypothetical protein